MKQELRISKLDAAKRQLETVIRLYFFHGEPVSIHTLAVAAYNVIHDVTAKRGATPMVVKDELAGYVKPEHRDAFRRKGRIHRSHKSKDWPAGIGGSRDSVFG